MNKFKELENQVAQLRAQMEALLQSSGAVQIHPERKPLNYNLIRNIRKAVDASNDAERCRLESQLRRDRVNCQ